MEIEHAEVAPTLDVVVGDGEVGIVSDYVDGEPLRSLMRQAGLKRAPIPHKVALRIAVDFLEGLAAVHAHVEEDDEAGRPALGGLSPDCVFVGSDGSVRLIDVGIAGVLSSNQTYGRHPERASYAAPELMQADGEVDHRTDLFAAGVMLWEMLSNRRLFVGVNYDGIARKVLDAPIARLDTIPSATGDGLPSSLVDLVAKALDRAKEARFQNAKEMISAIESADVGTWDDTAELVKKLAAYSLSPRRKALERATGVDTVPLSSRFKSHIPPKEPGRKRTPPPMATPLGTRDVAVATAPPPPVAPPAPAAPLPVPPAPTATKAAPPPPPPPPPPKGRSPKATLLGIPPPARIGFPEDEAGTKPSVGAPPVDEEAPISVEAVSIKEIGPAEDPPGVAAPTNPPADIPPPPAFQAPQPPGAIPVPPGFPTAEANTLPSATGTETTATPHAVVASPPRPPGAAEPPPPQPGEPGPPEPPPGTPPVPPAEAPAGEARAPGEPAEVNAWVQALQDRGSAHDVDERIPDEAPPDPSLRAPPIIDGGIAPADVGARAAARVPREERKRRGKIVVVSVLGVMLLLLGVAVVIAATRSDDEIPQTDAPVAELAASAASSAEAAPTPPPEPSAVSHADRADASAIDVAPVDAGADADAEPEPDAAEKAEPEPKVEPRRTVRRKKKKKRRPRPKPRFTPDDL